LTTVKSTAKFEVIATIWQPAKFGRGLATIWNDLCPPHPNVEPPLPIVKWLAHQAVLKVRLSRNAAVS